MTTAGLSRSVANRLPHALRRQAGPLRDRALHLARRPLADRHLLPDFVIIGAAKSGTSSLRESLMEHPSIRMSLKPEVHYFDLNHHRSSQWYRAHFPSQRTRDRVLRERGEFVAGEKTPAYLPDPQVPARVAALLPGVRLLVLIRDPVSRAISHHHHWCRVGREQRPLEQALRDELARSAHGVADPLGYIARGRYAEQLERWLAYFDRAQIHVTISERLFAEPGAETGRIERFLGLTPRTQPRVGHANRGSGRSEISPELRDQLREAFDDDVGRLAVHLGERPDWW